MLTVLNKTNQKLLPQLVRICSRQAAVSLSTSALRYASENPLFEVGPYPRTKEERERAARKYNLIPEDYEPHEEGDALGDYPKLKAIGAFNRNPYDDFDDVWDNRFYGEVYHKDADLYQWERIDPLAGEKKEIPKLKLTLISIGSFLILPTLTWLFNRYDIHVNHPYKIRKSMPEGTKYYEFPNFELSEHDRHHHHHH